MFVLVRGILSVDGQSISLSDLVAKRDHHPVSIRRILKKSIPASFRRASRSESHLLISPPPLGERRNKGAELQHVSTPNASVCCNLPPSENTLLIGFRYLQNDLFNGITTRIMILFMREAIQALGRADNAFPVLWHLMLCYRGR